jgi:hypothetical protein
MLRLGGRDDSGLGIRKVRSRVYALRALTVEPRPKARSMFLIFFALAATGLSS